MRKIDTQQKKAAKESKNQLLESIQVLLNPISSPANYYSGLTWQGSGLPDNIVVFRRTDPSFFAYTGKGSNYHHRFELVVPLKSTGFATIDDHDFLLKPGYCALVFPNQFHRYSDIKTDSMDWLFITFEVGDPTPYETLRNSPRLLSRKSLSLIRGIMKDYLEPEDRKSDHLDFFYALTSLLKNLPKEKVIEPVREKSDASKNQQDIIVDQIKNYLGDHLNDAPDLKTMAKDLDFSVSYLRAVFRDQIGVGLGRYIREARLAEAAKLLQSTDLKVSEISDQCGFSSLFAFSRAFKRAYDMSPKSYALTVRK